MKNNIHDNEYFKGYARLILILFISIIILFTSFDKVINNQENIKYFIMVLVIILGIFASYIIIKRIYIKHLDINYIRQLPLNYSLPIIAFLYNKDINIDHIVMALKLKFKRINDISQLSMSEKYVYDWLHADDRSTYSVSGFNFALQTELNLNNMLGKHADKSRIIFIMLVIAILIIIPFLSIFGIIPYDSYTYIIGIGFGVLMIFAIIYSFLPKSLATLSYSKLARKEHYNVLGFYKFLSEFTVLDKRKMLEYPLWNEYLEFAVLFGINNNYLYEKDLNLITDREFDEVIRKMGQDNQ